MKRISYIYVRYMFENIQDKVKRSSIAKEEHKIDPDTYRFVSIIII